MSPRDCTKRMRRVVNAEAAHDELANVGPPDISQAEIFCTGAGFFLFATIIDATRPFVSPNQNWKAVKTRHSKSQFFRGCDRTSQLSSPCSRRDIYDRALSGARRSIASVQGDDNCEVRSHPRKNCDFEWRVLTAFPV